jgi:hypothetical protein
MKDLKYLDELVFSHNQWMFYGDESLELLRKNEKDNFYKISILKILSLKITICLAPLAKLFFIYLSQFSFNFIKSQSDKKISHYVAQLERGYRHRNYFKYINVSKEIKYEMINIFEREKYSKFRYLSLTKILRQAYKNYKNIFLFLQHEHSQKLFKAISGNVIINIATYSYFCALFEDIKESNPSANFYNAGGEDLSTYASIQEGVNTHFIAHGLMDFIPMILFPRFTSCWLYSQVEADIIQQTLDNAIINLYPMEQVTYQDKTLIIFLGYEQDLTELAKENLLNVANFFKKNEYTVYIKPHPDSDGLYVNEFIKVNKCKLLEQDESTTDLVLKKMKVSFVASWGSTTECEALRSGVLPINLGLGRLYHLCKYPFADLTLSWSDDQDKIQRAINSPEEYNKVLNELSK